MSIDFNQDLKGFCLLQIFENFYQLYLSCKICFFGRKLIQRKKNSLNNARDNI